MIYDIHVHTFGEHPDNFLSPALFGTFSFRLFCSRFGLPWMIKENKGFSHGVEKKTIDWLTRSSVNYAVVLALDAPYLTNGERDEKNVRVIVSNDYVAALSDSNEKVLFGASIHPYRRDAISELERFIKRGACLVKWLPGAQNIKPDNPQCFEFYDALAYYGLPLLCHTGSEHVLRNYPDSFNDPRLLVPALDRGVTVIAAHCGTRIFFNEPCFFSAWCELAKKYEKLYGDLGAFITFGRLGSLRQILKDRDLTNKLVFGSDFPALHFPLQYITRIGVSAAFGLQLKKNPFDQAIMTFRSAGVPDAVFSRGGDLIRAQNIRHSKQLSALPSL